MKLILLLNLASCLKFGNTRPSISMPVYSQTFIPSFQVFSKHADLNYDNMLITDMNLTTSVPTVRLDNFPHAIETISCSHKKLTITFYQEETCRAAFEAWKDVSNLAFLIGYEHGCNRLLEGTVLVDSMEVDLKKSQIITRHHAVDRDYVVDDWNAVITEQTPPPNYKLVWKKQKAFSLDVNLDAVFKKLGDPAFGLFGLNLIHFQNCYSNGSVKYKLELHGHRRTLISYKFNLNGEFNATADVKLGFLPNQEIRVFKSSLLLIPMTPLYIPGVLVIGPAFQIQLGVVGFSDMELSIGFGFDFHLPIDYEISSHDLKSEPQHKIDDRIVFNPHPLKTTRHLNASYIGGLINIRPRFVFGIQIMNTDICSIRGVFNNQLGIIHRFKNATACRQNNSVEIFHRHFIGASIKSWPAELSWNFWDTGRKLMYASCPADVNKESFAETAFLNATERIMG